MSMLDLRATFQEVFRNVFDDPTIVLRDQMNAKDFDDWDSLQHINLIIAVEKRLQIRFTTSEIARLKQPDQTIGSFVQLIERKTMGQ